MRKSPRVTVVLPIYNEREHVARCLESILGNDYPADRVEILAVDGGSSDGTRAILAGYAARHPRLRILDNPARSIPAALNRGLRAATGDILVRMDAHALYEPDYIRCCVELLETTGAAGVGGRQRHRGYGYKAQAIAAALGSRFAAGDAAYRRARDPRWTDTVYLGAWRTEAARAVGGWDEGWSVNEDYEFNLRLREWHYRRTGSRDAILLSPEIRSWYFGRSRFRALARQYFRYGYWKAGTVRRHPDATRWRQLVAPGFVGLTAVSGVFAPWTLLPMAVLLGAYGLTALVASLGTAARTRWSYFPLLPVVSLVVHTAWGSGFLAGAARFGLPAPGRLLRAGVASLRADRPAGPPGARPRERPR